MKTAVVTGSSYGIGKGIVEILLECGFKVYGISRTNLRIGDSNFVWIKTDLLIEDDVKNVNIDIKEDKIDLLANNAGTALLEKALKLTKTNFNNTFGPNFLAPIKLTALLNEKLYGGLIINISSVSDRFVGGKDGLYSASKAAPNIYFEAVALENKKLKIISILPSFVDTPLLHNLFDSSKDFEWNVPVKANQVANSIKYIIDNHEEIPNCSKIIIVNNNLMDDIHDPEKLYYYNVDTKEFKKLK